MIKVMVVDDDRFMRKSLAESLAGSEFEGDFFESADAAYQALDQQVYEIVVTDLKMPGMSGLEFLAKLAKNDQHLPVILITAHGTIETAVQAMREGAYDYIQKPFGCDELLMVMRKAYEHRKLLGENAGLRGALKQQLEDRPLLGESAAMVQVRDRISRVALSDATVLIRGETGTGKELVARAVHNESPRRSKPFLCVNCAALSAGLLESELFGHEKGAFTGADQRRAGRFELAEGGSLLLDEVSEIEPRLQAKLLRVLQEKEFERVGSGKSQKADVRVLATTNRNLEEEVQKGDFREDLYFRLNIVPIQLPPLRERKDDILPLSEHFLKNFERKSGAIYRPLSADSKKRMLAYHWPGNVRELENMIERATLLSVGDETEIGNLDTPARQSQPADFEALSGLSMEEVERAFISETLKNNGGHQKKTAESLGIGVRTLREKMKKWGLSASRKEASKA